jgi:hypothetical protein
MLQTEFSFTLPFGYRDAEGSLHREGVMRLATAFDEIVPLKDPRVHNNPAYLLIILLSRVVTRLGELEQINPKVMEGLFAADLAYLQDLYRRINENGHNLVRAECPHCQQQFDLELDGAGGGWRYPLERLYEEVAYICYHFHWPHDQVLALEHGERRQWVAEIAKINRRLNDEDNVP